MPNTRRGSRGTPGLTSEQLADRLSKGYLDFAFGYGDAIKERMTSLEPFERAVREFYEPGGVGLGGLAGTIIGPGGLLNAAQSSSSKVASNAAKRLESLEAASNAFDRLLKKGIDPEAAKRGIFSKTGWSPLPQNAAQWRQVLAHKNLPINQKAFDHVLLGNQQQRFPDVFPADTPELALLYEAYPKLAEAIIRRGRGARYLKNDNVVEGAFDRNKGKNYLTNSIFGHEGSHVIQSAEGFPGGAAVFGVRPPGINQQAFNDTLEFIRTGRIASKTQTPDELIESILEGRKIAEGKSSGELRRLINRIPEVRDWMQAEPMPSYLRSIGEAEARAADRNLTRSLTGQQVQYPGDLYTHESLKFAPYITPDKLWMW